MSSPLSSIWDELEAGSVRHAHHVLVGWIGAVNLVAFALRFMQYYTWWTASGWTAVARGSACAIQLNLAILFVSMMRVTVARLRYFAWARCLALDCHVHTHKIAGHALWVWSLVHMGAYAMKYALGHPFLPSHPPEVAFRIAWSGAAVCLLVAAMWLCAQTCIRWTRHFEWFYYTHFLCIPVAALLAFLHAPWTLAIAMVLPLGGYMLDRAYRFACSFFPHQIIGWTMHPGKVLEVRMSRPAIGWNGTRPGDYLFMLIPSISKWEWHPLTISSASSRPTNAQQHHNDITFHLRVVGNWTTALLHSLQQGYEELNGVGLRMHSQNKHPPHRAAHPLIYIDGPLSSPASSMLDYLVKPHYCVVLIATGIGATPFVALLQRLLRDRERQPCPDRRLDVTRRLVFIWHERDEASVAWAKPMLDCAVQQLGIRITLVLDTPATRNEQPTPHSPPAAAVVGRRQSHRIQSRLSPDDSQPICNAPQQQQQQQQQQPSPGPWILPASTFNWTQALTDIKNTAQTCSTRHMVYFCGAHKLAMRLDAITRSLHWTFKKENY